MPTNNFARCIDASMREDEDPTGCLSFMFGIFSRPSNSRPAHEAHLAKTMAPSLPPAPPPSLYIPNESFLSRAEAAFLSALRDALKDECEIFVKVRLLDVMSAKSGRGWQTAFNKIQSKHLDFLICERVTYRPLVAIELDDRSHQRSDRRIRDAFVDEALEGIGLPILHCPVTRAYDPRELARLIEATVERPPTT